MWRRRADRQISAITLQKLLNLIEYGSDGTPDPLRMLWVLGATAAVPRFPGSQSGMDASR